MFVCEFFGFRNSVNEGLYLFYVVVWIEVRIKKITLDFLCMVSVNVPTVYDMVLIFFNITPVST